jgi:hypothetical protein
VTSGKAPVPTASVCVFVCARACVCSADHSTEIACDKFACKRKTAYSSIIDIDMITRFRLRANDSSAHGMHLDYWLDRPPEESYPGSIRCDGGEAVTITGAASGGGGGGGGGDLLAARSVEDCSSAAEWRNYQYYTYSPLANGACQLVRVAGRTTSHVCEVTQAQQAGTLYGCVGGCRHGGRVSTLAASSLNSHDPNSLCDKPLNAVDGDAGAGACGVTQGN